MAGKTGRSVAACNNIGRELVAVKERVGHGRYTAFVTDRLGWLEWAGRNFVTVYEMLKTANFADLENLTIDASSLYQSTSGMPGYGVARSSSPSSKAAGSRMWSRFRRNSASAM
jgi:hypothetical protein